MNEESIVNNSKASPNEPIKVTQVKEQSLLRSTSLVSLMTFISRMVGFVRDMIIAQLFGAQAGMDAFYVAFRIPNFMRRLFAEGAFSQAFVPVLAEYQQTRPFEDVRSFIAHIFGQLSVVLSIVTFLGILGAPLIISLFAPGFGEGSVRAHLASEMLRLTFPFLMLVSLTAMAGAILNTYGYFGIPAFTPVILNLSMIAAALYLSPQLSQPVVALAWGVLAAGILQLLFQIPFLWKRHLLVKPLFVLGNPEVKRILGLMVPALFGVSVAQINLMIDSIFASFLKIGSVTWLYYTDRLTDFPLGVFGVAIATVILPHLSKKHAAEHQERFSEALDWGLRSILLIAIPSGLSLAFFAIPLISSCFGYGEFTRFDILQTQKSLITLGLGIPAFMLIKVLVSGFYATQDIKTPVKIGAWTMLLNSLFCLALVWSLAHAGLALASSLAAYVNAGALWFILWRRKRYQPAKGWGVFLLQLFFANLILVVYLIAIRGSLEQWLARSAGLRLGVLLAEVALAIIVYLSCLRLTGMKLEQFRGKIKKK